MTHDEFLDSVVQHARADMAAAPSMWVDPAAPVQETPSSEGVLYGEWRRGLKDMQNTVLDPWNGQVATHEEPGTIANPTQAMVTQDVGTVWGHQHDAYLDQAAQPVSRTIASPNQALATQDAGTIWGNQHDAYLDQAAQQVTVPEPQMEMES